MPDKLLQQKLYPYDGSEDVTRNPILISPVDIIESDNIIYTTYSTKKKRPGLSYAFPNYETAARHVLAIIDYWKIGTQRVVFWDGQYIKAIDPLTGIVTNITGTAILPIDQTCTFLRFYGVLIIFFGGGQTPPYYWAQTGNIQILLDPVTYAGYNPPFGQLFLNRLAIPDSVYPGRILLSKTNDPTDFFTGDATAVDCGISDGDPDGVTALFPEYLGSLYVAKRFTLYEVSLKQFVTADTAGATTITNVFVPKRITDGIGCISHNGVIAAENDIYFPSDRGIHSLVSTRKFAQIETNFLTAKIQPSWTSNVNFNRSQYIQGVYDIANNSLLWVYPSATYSFPTEVRGYSLIADKWFKWENYNQAAVAWYVQQNYNYPTDLRGYSLTAQKWFKWVNYNQTAVAGYVEAQGRKVRTIVGGLDGSIGIIDTDVKTDYGKKISLFVQSGIIVPNGMPDDEFEFNYIAPIFVPQISGKFRVIMKIDGKVINELTFDMTDATIGANLGLDFVTGQSYLGGLPTVKIDKKRCEGRGMMYQLFIEHIQEDDEDPCDFELLGILMDVDTVSKSTGTRVA